MALFISYRCTGTMPCHETFYDHDHRILLPRRIVKAHSETSYMSQKSRQWGPWNGCHVLARLMIPDSTKTLPLFAFAPDVSLGCQVKKTTNVSCNSRLSRIRALIEIRERGTIYVKWVNSSAAAILTLQNYPAEIERHEAEGWIQCPWESTPLRAWYDAHNCSCLSGPGVSGTGVYTVQWDP